jgi:hypothetical protein
MARRIDQDNFKILRSKNKTDIAQSVGGINVAGKKVAVLATTAKEIGYDKVCRVVTGGSVTTLSFGDSTIAAEQVETITLPANSINYVITTDDYVYASAACTFEVINI